jgi:hypothetical protein
MCVNGDLASVDNQNSDYVSAQYMQYGYSQTLNARVTQCADLPIENEGLYKFVLLAQFTSHSSIPPYLQGKQFFTRCNDPTTNTDVYTITGMSKKSQPPCQYFGCATGTQATPDKLLFTMVQTEKTLAEVCAEA